MRDPTTTAPCPACDRVALSLGAGHPLLIAELGETIAVLHKHQFWEGWVTLLLKDHAEHLGLLPVERQLRIASDVAVAAAAMHRALPGLRRINYECLGNVLPHLHWHLVPRYDAPRDPQPGATVWVRPPGELEAGVDSADAARLVAALQQAGLRSPGAA